MVSYDYQTIVYMKFLQGGSPVTSWIQLVSPSTPPGPQVSGSEQGVNHGFFWEWGERLAPKKRWLSELSVVDMIFTVPNWCLLGQPNPLNPVQM